MVRAARRLRSYILGLLASLAVIVLACLALNCLVDPLWYLRGNIVSGINYPFNERLSKLVRLLPRLHDYDCVFFGTSRTTLLPQDKAKDHRCYNLAVSDGQVSEYLATARYLQQRGFAPTLLIVEIRRGDLIGPEAPAEVPDFVRSGSAPPALLASYLTLDALGFSIRTLRQDAPHHRYYDKDFKAHLEVRSKKRWYRPSNDIEPAPPPYEFHADRIALYRQVREVFPTARAIAYVPLESAWRMAAFSLTPAFDPYLAALADIAASYDRLLDFSLPSPTTMSKDPHDTYDGVHYSRTVNTRVLADLFAPDSGTAVDWRRADRAQTAALFHRQLAQFIETAKADRGPHTATGPRKKAQPNSD